MRVENGNLVFDDGSMIMITINQENELNKAISKDGKKERVKQALKLKEAGFTGKEIIDIIGEIE